MQCDFAGVFASLEKTVIFLNLSTDLKQPNIV